MVSVEFLGPIGKSPLQLQVQSLRELSALLAQDPELSAWLQSCAVAVNDVLVSSLDTPLRSGDRVALLPPVCGG
ncbi:MAG: MoaD/ThiS family protein [Campylobacterales bacterium]|nr:MoaD/ThiS family protein [Campylobacterales bacterium]